MKPQHQVAAASKMGETTPSQVPATSGARPHHPNDQKIRGTNITPEERHKLNECLYEAPYLRHLSSDALSSMEKRAEQPPIEKVPSPAYSDTYGHVDFSQDGLDTQARVAHDGRVNIHINQKSRRFSDLLLPALRSQLKVRHGSEEPIKQSTYIPSALGGTSDRRRPPPMNVVIHVVGSRGDVQPFVALGLVLKKTYGHRIRLATHETFRVFVEENGLEFFSIGGDPAELMAFMVKNPGLMPGMESLKSGDVGKRRKGMYEIIQGCWRSCFEAGDGTGLKVSDDHLDSPLGRNGRDVTEGEAYPTPFVADAIIANPPSFAHIHCAEKLGIPLHLMFTMPWSPTQAFPHPLANIQSSNADTSITNFISYALVEMMTWQGLGDIINRFREDQLGLEPVSVMWAPGMASRLRIPYTYCWSPALIPKPKDWGSHISISGFYFLSLANNFTPQPELAAFLEAGPPPVYIGFGSIVVDDPSAMTKLIFDAIRITGQRALVSKGWGGIGIDALDIPEGVFMLGNVPHDWLFKHVSCVVHHGGAGTTAAGIAMGRPTVVVPFFGDQPFWGAMVAKAGAGPLPVPSKHLTASNLAAAILEALNPVMLERAQELGEKMKSEQGSQTGAKSFHDCLNLETLRCQLSPKRAAAWRIKRTQLRLSPFAATTLSNEGLLDFADLKLYRPIEYDAEDGPWEPISGGASALLGTIGSLTMGFADFPVEIFKAMRSKPAESPKLGETPRLPSRPSVSGSSPSDANNITKANSSTRTIPTIPKLPALTDVNTDTVHQAPNETERRDKLGKHGTQDGSVHRSDSSLSPSSQPESFTPRVLSHRTNTGISSPHVQRTLSGSQLGHIPLDAAVGAGKSLGRIVGAGLKSPMDFTLSLARGFHNAPKLYGDESVRQGDKITGIQSGLKAAGKEFGLGFYDGISGLITQPLEGAKKQGVVGLIKGFGKGIGGVVLKPGAAIWGLPGYTFMGIYKELQKLYGSSVHNYIAAARTVQGAEDWKISDRYERQEVVRRWHEMQSELLAEKEHNTFHSPRSFLKHGHKSSFDDGKKNSHSGKSSSRKDRRDENLFNEQRNTSIASTTATSPLETQTNTFITPRGPSDDIAFEEAMQASGGFPSGSESRQNH